MTSDSEDRTDREEVRDRSRSRMIRAIRFVREQGFGEVWRLARLNGFSGSTQFAYRNLRYVVATGCDRAFDFWHGIDTSGDVPAAFLDATGDNAAAGNQFVPTSVQSFIAALAPLPSDITRFSFVDIGSGKGRTLLLAARRPFAKVIGIEYAPSLVEVAKINVKSYRGNPPLQCKDIQSICADATTTAFPETPLVVYFFNPFAFEIFEKVAANIFASYRAAQRPIFLVYVSALPALIDRVSDLLVGSGVFESQPAKQLPYYLDAPWQLRCQIFHTKEAS